MGGAAHARRCPGELLQRVHVLGAGGGRHGAAARHPLHPLLQVLHSHRRQEAVRQLQAGGGEHEEWRQPERLRTL